MFANVFARLLQPGGRGCTVTSLVTVCQGLGLAGLGATWGHCCRPGYLPRTGRQLGSEAGAGLPKTALQSAQATPSLGKSENMNNMNTEHIRHNMR